MSFGLLKKKLHILITLAVVFIFAIAYIIPAALAETNKVEAASNDDFLLASKDYVDQEVGKVDSKVKELTDKIAELTKTVEDLRKQLGTRPEESTKFQVLVLEKGQKLIGGEGTEIIFRGGDGGGKAIAIGSESGGLADVTSGGTINTGENIPVNHLLIISRDDGRGLEVTSKNAYLLVKGPYEIKQANN